MTRCFAGTLAFGGLLVLSAACSRPTIEDERYPAEESYRGTGYYRDDSQEVFRMGSAGLRPSAPTAGEMGPSVPSRPAPQTGENPYAPAQNQQRGAGQAGGTAPAAPPVAPPAR